MRYEDFKIAQKDTIKIANRDGRKEVLGMWLGKNESSAFWMGVLTDLKAGLSKAIGDLGVYYLINNPNCDKNVLIIISTIVIDVYFANSVGAKY